MKQDGRWACKRSTKCCSVGLCPRAVREIPANMTGRFKTIQVTNSQNRTEKAPRFRGGTDVSTRYQTRANTGSMPFFLNFGKHVFLGLNICHSAEERWFDQTDRSRPKVCSCSAHDHSIQFTDDRILGKSCESKRGHKEDLWPKDRLDLKGDRDRLKAASLPNALRD